MSEDEDPAALDAFCDLVTRGLATSLIFLLHSVPEPKARVALAAFRKKEPTVLGETGLIVPCWLGSVVQRSR